MIPQYWKVIFLGGRNLRGLGRNLFTINEKALRKPSAILTSVPTKEHNFASKSGNINTAENEKYKKMNRKRRTKTKEENKDSFVRVGTQLRPPRAIGIISYCSSHLHAHLYILKNVGLMVMSSCQKVEKKCPHRIQRFLGAIGVVGPRINPEFETISLNSIVWLTPGIPQNHPSYVFVFQNTRTIAPITAVLLVASRDWVFSIPTVLEILHTAYTRLFVCLQT